jgi:hypothetical protein
LAELTKRGRTNNRPRGQGDEKMATIEDVVNEWNKNYSAKFKFKPQSECELEYENQPPYLICPFSGCNSYYGLKIENGKFTIRLCSTKKIPHFQQLFNEGFQTDTWNNLQNKINRMPSKIRKFMASKGPNKEWGWWPKTKPRKFGEGLSPVMNFIMYIDNSNNLNDIIDEIKEFKDATYDIVSGKLCKIVMLVFLVAIAFIMWLVFKN